jgi:hypothetical protein
MFPFERAQLTLQAYEGNILIESPLLLSLTLKKKRNDGYLQRLQSVIVNKNWLAVTSTYSPKLNLEQPSITLTILKLIIIQS